MEFEETLRPGTATPQAALRRRDRVVALLPDMANPVPCKELRFDQTEQMRYLDCQYYSLCLDIAVLYYWESFSCLECPYNEERSKEKGGWK